MSRAQVSIEYIAVFSFALLMIFPLIIIFATQNENMQTDIAQAQSYRALAKIVNSAEEVYFQGPPSQKTIRVSIPKGISSAYVNYSYIEFNINTINGNYSIYRDTVANLTGTIKTFEGEHVITLKAEGNQLVIIDN